MATTPAVESTRNQKNQRGGRRPGAGRKRGSVTRATPEQKASLENRAQQYADRALATLVEIATQGESESARVTAASALLDRGYGKPRQAVEHAGAEGGPLEIVVRVAREGRRVTAS